MAPALLSVGANDLETARCPRQDPPGRRAGTAAVRGRGGDRGDLGGRQVAPRKSSHLREENPARSTNWASLGHPGGGAAAMSCDKAAPLHTQGLGVGGCGFLQR